jgi:putative transposase
MLGFLNPHNLFMALAQQGGDVLSKRDRNQYNRKEYNCSSNNECATMDRDTRFLAQNEILKTFDSFILATEVDKALRLCKILQTDLQFQFCTLYNDHLLNFDGFNPYSVYSQISRATLCRWLKNRNENPQALGNGRGGANNIGSKIEKHPETEEAILNCLAQGKTRWSIPQIIKVLQTQFDLPFIPTESQLRRFIKSFQRDNYFQWLFFKNKDEFKSKTHIAFGSASESLTRPNERWELDGTKTDVMLMTENGMKRYQIIGLIDVFTRRVKLHLAPSESSQNTLHALRDTIIEWGLPEQILTDNGSGFTAKRTQAFLARLGIELKFCPPGQPQKKPHIERFFRTFNHDLLPLLPGFIGHNVAERQAIQSHGEVLELAMTPDDFQKWCDQWCKDYEIREHSGINTTPLEKYTNAIANGFIRKNIADVRLLDYLLMDGTPRKVRKDGIQVNNKIYIAPELGGIIGDSVYVCYEIKNPDEIIVYSDELLETFICKAQWRDGYLVDKQAISQQAKVIQNKVLEEGKTVKKNSKKLAKKLEDPFSLLNQNTVTPLQKTETIENKSVDSIQSMLDSTKPVEIVESVELENERKAEILEFRQKKEALISEKLEGDIATQQQRFKQVYLLKLQGGDLSQTDNEFIDRFSATPGGKAIKSRLDSTYHRRAL